MEPAAEFEYSSQEESSKDLTDEDSQDTCGGFKEILLERLNVVLPLYNITPVVIGQII